jgi:hypothetical protein
LAHGFEEFFEVLLSAAGADARAAAAAASAVTMPGVASVTVARMVTWFWSAR